MSVVFYRSARRDGILKALEKLSGPSLSREYQREDIEKVLFKKIKVRFPILFKRALEYHLVGVPLNESKRACLMKKSFQFLDKGCPRPAAFSGSHSYGKPFWQQSGTSPSTITQGIERISNSFALSATIDFSTSKIVTSSSGPARLFTRSIASKHIWHIETKTSICRFLFVCFFTAITD